MNEAMLAAAAYGFLSGLSLIFVIGAQNAFILQQGLMREHVFWLCSFCATSDAILIVAGVSTFGEASSTWPHFEHYLALFGATFLAVYGTRRIWRATTDSYRIHNGAETRTLGAAVGLAAVFTWANPHVYLDTVAVIGSISTIYQGGARWTFALGAIFASYFFFFSLGYGAAKLSPILKSPGAWKFLDLAIGLLMWWLAIGLVL